MPQHRHSGLDPQPRGAGLTGGYTRNSCRHSGLDPESTGRGTGIIGLLSPAQAGITLTFDSSPIKGEGDDADASLYGLPLPRGMTDPPPPLWIAEDLQDCDDAGASFCGLPLPRGMT